MKRKGYNRNIKNYRAGRNNNNNLAKIICTIILIPIVIGLLYILFKSFILAMRLFVTVIGLALAPILFLIILFTVFYFIIYVIRVLRNKR